VLGLVHSDRLHPLDIFLADLEVQLPLVVVGLLEPVEGIYQLHLLHGLDVLLYLHLALHSLHLPVQPVHEHLGVFQFQLFLGHKGVLGAPLVVELLQFIVLDCDLLLQLDRLVGLFFPHGFQQVLLLLEETLHEVLFRHHVVHHVLLPLHLHVFIVMQLRLLAYLVDVPL